MTAVEGSVMDEVTVVLEEDNTADGDEHLRGGGAANRGRFEMSNVKQIKQCMYGLMHLPCQWKENG